MSNKEASPIGQSIVALLAGFVAVIIITLITDQLLHIAGVYPPWGQPMNETSDNLIALSYRLVYGIGGGFLTAWLAPAQPMKHALILGVIGTVLSLLGVFAATQADLGPLWYPIAIAVTALPTAWAGGKMFTRNYQRR
jgi:hypothetical protein